MFYRTIVSLIVVFWVVMSVLLIRTQYFSGDDDLLPVPVEFVTRLMFHHEQADDLLPYYQGRRLEGNLHLQPKHLPHGVDGHPAPFDLLSGSGSFALDLPGTSVHRLTFRGVVELDDHQQLQRLEMTASLHEARQTGAGMTVFVEGWAVRDDWHYVVKQAGVVLREDRGPLAKLVAAADPHLPGLDLRSFEQIQHQQAAATRFTAHRGTLRANGESIETFVVTIRQGETLESTIHFGQLGQILAVKTFAGYDLYDEQLAP